MPVTSLLSIKVGSLFTKLPDLPFNLRSRMTVNACMVYILESRLNSNDGDSLISIEGFDIHRLDINTALRKPKVV